MIMNIDAVARDFREEYSVTVPDVTLDRSPDGTGSNCSRFVAREIFAVFPFEHTVRQLHPTPCRSVDVFDYTSGRVDREDVVSVVSTSVGQ